MESSLAFGFSILAILFSYFISLKLTIGRVQINLTNKDIEYLWLKKPFFTFQNNESIKIESIKSWKYRDEFQYSYFKIYNPSESITIMRLPNWSPEKDEFDNFLFTFKKRIDNLNKKREKRAEYLDKKEVKDEKNELIIDKEAEHYKSNIAKILFFVYVFSGVLGAKYVFNNWNTGKTNIGMAIFGILGCIFYISKYRNLGNNK